MTTHEQSILTNVAKANEQLDKIQGDRHVDYVQAAMSVANAYMLAALVNAVQDLTDEIRKAQEARGGESPVDDIKETS